jgi:ribonuclease BN (tRNA processing enzyme)
MRITVLGGCGAWPGPGQACSGYVVEHDGFKLLIDPGYATLPRLLERMAAEDVNAVLISHGHPDHCADLHPLLRARAFGGAHPPPLPVYTLSGAVDRVLSLDGPGSLEDEYALLEFNAGDRFEVGPFQVDSWLLPHFVPNAGLRLTDGQGVVAYTGDTGPSPDVIKLAQGADLFLAEASFPEEVPSRSAGYLSSARQAGQYATEAEVKRLLLTHMLPGTSREAIESAANQTYSGKVAIAHGGLVVELD